MKAIKKQELYRHVGRFLKSKGIELTEGSYTRGIHAGCSLLADAINMSQNGLERAKRGLDKTVDRLDNTVDHLRQAIHEKTAPKAGAFKGAPGARTTSASSGLPPIIVEAGKTTVKATKKPKAKSSRTKSKARPRKAR